MSTRANADLVRQLRISKGLSQQALALEAKVGESTIQRAESGKPVRPGTLVDLARVLGVTFLEISERIAVGRPPSITNQASARPRRLGKYGQLLAAICDTSREVLHWRRGFADTFMYASFFMRKHDPAVFAHLDAASHLAATVSLTLHRDVAEAVKALKRMHHAIEEAGAALRGAENTGYRLSPAAQKHVLTGGTRFCDETDFHLKRAEAELRAVLGLAGGA